ncbi:MAG TPA: hypothetical protein VEC01_06570 [Noviherbaspirillum sp.]|uniref:hypothetical protein n=1 Tax=Noviherbaspirillum sp. TaxID=1926288 RepID=UPI002D61614A|nr:hypothetical protein [Noviherbaspirillum sp.]HYD94971.1 hypothetical protein [Noviherbaspirillum sp.]
MKKNLVWALLAAGFGCAAPAQAQVGLTASVGTGGLGLHASVPVHPQMHARFGVNALNYSYDGSTTNVDYDYRLKLRTFDALLDYFPNESGLRLSAGVVYNGNKIDAHGRPTAAGTYRLNGRSYPAATAGTLEGRVDFRNLAPYLGVGWGNPAAKEKGWAFSADLGVLFQGSPRTSLANVGCTAPVLVCTQLAADVAAENRELQDDVNDFKAYPVVRLGVSYRF